MSCALGRFLWGNCIAGPVQKQTKKKMLAANSCIGTLLYLFRQRGIEGLNQALRMRLPRNDFKVLSQSRWKNNVIN